MAVRARTKVNGLEGTASIFTRRQRVSVFNMRDLAFLDLEWPLHSLDLRLEDFGPCLPEHGSDSRSSECDLRECSFGSKRRDTAMLVKVPVARDPCSG